MEGHFGGHLISLEVAQQPEEGQRLSHSIL